MHMRILCATMRSIEAVRRHVFALSQQAFAAELGVNQSTVSRWEQGTLEPAQSDLDGIRRLAQARGREWEDLWFFEGPPAPAQPDAFSDAPSPAPAHSKPDVAA